MSATPEPTASSTSKAGTTSPAANTATCSRPPDVVLMRSATRSADMPGPGRRFGHDVTMRHLTGAARATAGAASPPTAAGPDFISLRRVSVGMASPSSPPGVKMMHGAVARPDREPVGAGDRERHIGLGLANGFDQPEALREPRRDRR